MKYCRLSAIKQQKWVLSFIHYPFLLAILGAFYLQIHRSMSIKPELPAAVLGLITQAREQAVRAVDAERVLLYWHIVRVILEEEQHGADRAAYGSNLIKGLAIELQP
jgi:hypothetical protein